MGAATTGSGRYLTGDFIGADLVRNEITAQATAAAAIDPEVDTIFEIGGQDSKFISLSNGAIVDFMMNKVCAAGTGSYLEEQAEKLGISHPGRVRRPGPGIRKPGAHGRTLHRVHGIRHRPPPAAGRRQGDLVAGLSYSIVQNYLNKVAEDRPIGKRIFYQGATAANRGIVAAFQQVCGKPINVPPHHDVTGAIGAALLAMRERDWEVSRFKGFDLADRKYKITSFECKSCPNNCEIRQVQIEGEKPLFYGSRCEKYEVAANQKQYDLPDLLKEREDWLYGPEPPQEGKRGAIGLPRAMFFQELMPFFRAFFEDLGFTVVYSQKTNKSVINQGIEALAAEPCYPVKVAHGHLLDLLKAGVKRIFLPSIIDMANPNPEIQAGVVCPMAQSLCYTAPIAIDFAAYNAKVLSPVLYFGRGEKRLRQGLQDLGKDLGVSIFQVKRAMRRAVAAQEAYFQHLRTRGQEILDSYPQGRPPHDPHRPALQRPGPGHEPQPASQAPAIGRPGHAHGLPAGGSGARTWMRSSPCTGASAKRSWAWPNTSAATPASTASSSPTSAAAPTPLSSISSRTACAASLISRSKSTNTPPTWAPSPAWRPSWTA